MTPRPMRCGLAATSVYLVIANTTCDARSVRSDGSTFELTVSGTHNNVAIFQGLDEGALHLDVLAN